MDGVTPSPPAIAAALAKSSAPMSGSGAPPGEALADGASDGGSDDVAMSAPSVPAVLPFAASATSFRVLEALAAGGSGDGGAPAFYPCPVCRKPQILDIDSLQVRRSVSECALCRASKEGMAVISGKDHKQYLELLRTMFVRH
jgi:hypothetical protein